MSSYLMPYLFLVAKMWRLFVYPISKNYSIFYTIRVKKLLRAKRLCPLDVMYTSLEKKHWLEPGSELYVTWIWIDIEVNMLYYVKFISSVTKKA